ncbi:heavy-metal-associated domain-containing protein [Pontibacter cellulosilyticus]|uniref:Cation transporter n=1 Tax=Pontibacter cellulosilyticus TaxID=1720253 RepID=A0A923N9C2_9BACT|nr:heavy-metal-associated domain-containing protein [Pontibacter cellulosilyticus]MBC5994594.1 cation transporter [Pontibacter cellulosilyticus]
MKVLKSLLVVLTLALMSFGANAQTQNKNEQTVKIKTSAVCDMCKTTLEKAMAYEKGVKASSLDVDSKVLTVVFDSRKTNVDNLRKAVNETGYDADDKPASERAYKRLDDCCKKGAH